VLVLLLALFFFDDPFHAVRGFFPFSSYPIFFSLAQATFLAMILFFWLIVVHSISSVKIIKP
jgi:Wnt-binding factor required for Wnt secretion